MTADAPRFPFEEPVVAASTAEERLRLDLDGWEGPLDLLLALARSQKVDLKQISILQLVEQYLDYIERAEHLSVELAADYLVMAAWLALLKSALLLPRDVEADPDPDELALRLQLRLQRLQAMREAGARLFARDRIGRDVFLREAPEGLRTETKRLWEASLFELLQAYGVVQARTRPVVHMVARREVMPLDAAIERLSRLIGMAVDWSDLRSFLPPDIAGDLRRSALASSFVAALELARTGKVDIRQDEAFSPLFVKKAR
ncbi:segregation/condensation protein A [Sphingomonas lacunae]|uniref:Segregation and condensation protein A n=1 Tax=Sphingomonas lacunae TaxID=2698828 RepID=A0A6M4AZ27_9SPHN|nr:ScpA family protein [Sphingomonas lacunae]QJQ33319.1 segregation/condensation protein A [Sphingomonas lacunae]